MIVECNVWCSENPENKDLGLDDGDIWMPMAIDFKSVDAIKKAGYNDFLGEGRATVHLTNDSFIIDIMYEDALSIWKKVKGA